MADEIAPTDTDGSADRLPWLERAPAATGIPAFQLVVSQDGFAIGRHVFSQNFVRLGRDAVCDVAVDDGLVSRAHALIERQKDGGWWLHDQQSANGTRVNGVKVDRPRRLVDGDTIGMGRTTLVFQTELLGSTHFEADDLHEEAPRRTDQRPLPSTSKEKAPEVTSRPPLPAGGARRTGPAGASSRLARALAEVDAAAGPRLDAPAGPVSGKHVRPKAPAAPAPPRPPATTAGAAGPATTSPPAAPAPDPTGEAFGQTLVLRPQRVADELRETSQPVRGWLQPTDGQRWSGAAGEGPPERPILVERDALLIGAGEDADVRVGGFLAPRVVAVLVRGLSGFSVNQVASWPWTTRVNGRLVTDREPLDDGDVLTIGGRTFTFRRGTPKG